MNSIVYHPDAFTIFWQKDITLHFREFKIKDREVPLHLCLSIPEEVRCTGRVPYFETKVENLAEFRKRIEHSVHIIKGDLWEFLANEANT